MKRQKILVGALLLSSHGFAVEEREVNPQQLCKRFEVAAEVYVKGSDGKSIATAMDEWSVYRMPERSQSEVQACGFKNSWSSRSGLFDDLLRIEHSWKITPSGQLTAEVKQFAMERGKEVLLGKEVFPLPTFTPIVWQSLHPEQKQVLVRFTPKLVPSTSQFRTETFPISGRDIMIHDDAGKIWAHRLNLRGTYVGVVTINGTIMVSYFPFEGAEVKGYARGEEMRLNLADDLSVTMLSKTALLPEEVELPVYVAFDADHRSNGLTSQTVFTRTTAEEFVRRSREP